MIVPTFANRLIEWQKRFGRHDLPWQGTRDAYRIWLSEIMLQQTQVGTVLPYYTRFLECFPTVDVLAQASIAAVLERWAGLGYYARARNLHRCAITVVRDYGGKFPAAPEALGELSGIGRSTASAISVFAYGTRAAILDGNVKRVLARCFGIEGFPGAAHTERTMWSLAESLLPERHIEAYTQGLMDLGSTRCTRHKPFCEACPMREICVARRGGRQSELPVARPRKVLPERTVSLLMLTDGQHVLLERLPPAGIWGGLLTLPECEEDKADELAQQHACRLIETKNMPVFRHSFSHFHLKISPLICRVERVGRRVMEAGWEWVEYDRIETAALPTPIMALIMASLKERA